MESKIAIIVDDGIATGATTKACIRFLSKLNPKHIYIATPVIAPSTLKEFEKECDGIFILSAENLSMQLVSFMLTFQKFQKIVLKSF